MRRVPSLRSSTKPASLSTFKCCDTAGRLTGSPRAISPTGLGPLRSRSSTARRVGSWSAVKTRGALVIAYRKHILTDIASLNSAGLQPLDFQLHCKQLGEQFGGGVQFEARRPRLCVREAEFADDLAVANDWNAPPAWMPVSSPPAVMSAE